MARHSWTNRIVPPLLMLAVTASVWYALDSRPTASVSPPLESSTSAKKLTPPKVTGVAEAVPQSVISPVITKQKGQIRFSVNAASFAHIQKVEYFVENQFVGTAYSQPYAVAVSENDLRAGQHTVVAKIYMAASTRQSQPTTFVATPKVSTGSTSSDETSPAATPAPSAPATTLNAPAGLTVSAATDGTSATLSWDAVVGATGYQIWRDGAKIATSSGTGYTDTALNPGQTYDYQVLAISSGEVSALSSAVPVTMPDPHVLGDMTSEPGLVTQSAPQPTNL